MVVGHSPTDRVYRSLEKEPNNRSTVVRQTRGTFLHTTKTYDPERKLLKKFFEIRGMEPILISKTPRTIPG